MLNIRDRTIRPRTNFPRTIYNSPAKKGTRILLEYSNHIFVRIFFEKYTRNEVERSSYIIHPSNL